MSTVWITGASSGLGKYTAQALVGAGFRVISGARSFSQSEGESDIGYRLPLDVTSAESMDAFCEKAYVLSGIPDALVLCAGILCLGCCEGYGSDEIRRVMDTDFFGQTEMISRVLPMMRKRGTGRIVCYSSVNGVLSTPFQGAYSAAKHALEGYAEALKAECAPFGIQVMLVEPGDHRGGSFAYRAVSRGTGEDSPYRASFDRVRSVIERDEGGGSDPAELGRKVARMLKRKRLPFRIMIGSFDQRLSVILHSVLPGNLFSRVISAYYHVKK